VTTFPSLHSAHAFFPSSGKRIKPTHNQKETNEASSGRGSGTTAP